MEIQAMLAAQAPAVIAPPARPAMKAVAPSTLCEASAERLPTVDAEPVSTSTRPAPTPRARLLSVHTPEAEAALLRGNAVAVQYDALPLVQHLLYETRLDLPNATLGEYEASIVRLRQARAHEVAALEVDLVAAERELARR
jgi:hypothetical protein